jgi:gliding motility-associated protein GldL
MAVGMVYSIGAAVVIVGALFKIMHWPGAGVMLTAGMMTEAILFTIGVFEKPHATYHWEHVFPSLVEDEAKPLNISGNIGGGVGVAMPGMEKMSDEDAKKLTESIKNMSETAAQLANISRVAGLTDSYANNLQKASEAAAQFATKQQNLDEATNALLSSYKGIADNMIAAEDKTKSFAEKASELSKNLGSINTSYELQLKGIQSQAAAIENQSNKINAVTAEFEKLHNAVSASSKNMDAYKQMTDQLAKNVSDLNNVYGNMLNAIKA